jgi:hypothetical protein
LKRRKNTNYCHKAAFSKIRAADPSPQRDMNLFSGDDFIINIIETENLSLYTPWRRFG